MAVLLKPPSGAQQVVLSDGGILHVNSSGYITCPESHFSKAMDAGCTIATLGVDTLNAADVNVSDALTPGRTLGAGCYRLLGTLTGADFDATTDQAIAIQGASKYIVDRIIATNASVSLTTAAGGVYNAASKGGTALVANTQAYTALSAAGKYLALTLESVADVQTAENLYLSLTTGQGVAATADLFVFGFVLE